MNTFDEKITKIFAGMVVRKDLSRIVKGNAIVPSYVLEYLLGQYCATNDEATINEGIESVKSILAKHYVHREEAEYVKSQIKEKGRYKVIDRVTVFLNEKNNTYGAVFSNLGIKNVIISSDYIKKHKKLLVGGVWCIVDLTFQFTDDAQSVPWVIETLKPIQFSNFDLEQYLLTRKELNKDE